MTKYILGYLNGFKDVGTVSPRTEREVAFRELWQKKKYAEALDHFPDQWKWMGIEHGDEVAGDIVCTIFTGLAFSERAFTVIHKAFPNETSIHHKFQIDNQILYWVNPIKVDFKDINITPHHLFSSEPLYTVYVSDEFRQLCTQHGFTGRSFTKLVKE